MINWTVAQEPLSLSGASLLGLITTGIYDDPLSIYREYIQNAADAAESSHYTGQISVEITVDPAERYIRIRDDGLGLSRGDVYQNLLPVGRSDKRLGRHRGFRGVGRLVGLAFAKTISFTTRTRHDQSVTRVTWHRDRLPSLEPTDVPLEQAILNCVDIETLLPSDYPAHFFDVELHNIAPHSSGALLNRDAVRNYIGEICPVSMGGHFPFAELLPGLFEGDRQPLTLKVTLNDELTPIQRPHGVSIRHSANKQAEFTEYQAVRIASIDGASDAAVGWIAHSTYLGAIPRGERVRGIRARMGNIQIGDEKIFDRLFVEERFNRWCVGELHILDPRIVPNARRDYFEAGPHLRNLENELKPVIRGIASRCRRESTSRNRTRKALAKLSTIEELYDLIASGYLTTQDSHDLFQSALTDVANLRSSSLSKLLSNDATRRLDHVEQRLSEVGIGESRDQFGNLSSSQIAICQTIFGCLAKLTSSPRAARDLIETVLTRILSESATSSLSIANTASNDKGQLP